MADIDKVKEVDMRTVQKVLGLSLTILCMTLIIISTYAAKPGGFATVFEKGDAIYSDLGEDHFLWFVGHSGLYWEWEDLNEEGNPNDPTDLDTHKIIEAGGYAHGVRESNFKKFYDCGTFWSVRTNSDLTWKQRLAIVHCAERQIKCKYSFIRYKSPRRSFRCDGLVEYCYEQVGVDLIPHDIWGPPKTFIWQQILTPWTQMHSGKFEIRTEAEVKEVRLVEPSGPGSLDAYASDGEYGSGITMVEFWHGYPDDTPFEGGTGIRLFKGWDPHNEDLGGNYTHNYYPNQVDHLYVKAFDQAGNYKIASLEMTYNLIRWPPGDFGAGPPPTPILLYRAHFGTVEIKLKNTSVGGWSHLGDMGEPHRARLWSTTYEIALIPDSPYVQPSAYQQTFKQYEVTGNPDYNGPCSDSCIVYYTGEPPTWVDTTRIADGTQNLSSIIQDWIDEVPHDEDYWTGRHLDYIYLDNNLYQPDHPEDYTPKEGTNILLLGHRTYLQTRHKIPIPCGNKIPGTYWFYYYY